MLFKRKKSRSSAHLLLIFFLDCVPIFCYWVIWAVCILWRVAPCTIICTYFLPFGRLSFCFVSDFFYCMKVFRFRSNFCIFASISFALGGRSKEYCQKAFSSKSSTVLFRSLIISWFCSADPCVCCCASIMLFWLL